MQKYIAFIDTFTEWLGKAVAMLIIPMILIVLYTAALRYFFKVPVSWGFEIPLFAYGIHAIFGGAYTLKSKGHVNVDMLPNCLPPLGKCLCEVFGFLVVAAVAAMVVYLGSRWAYKSTLILERSIHGTEFNPQIWWFKWIVPLTGATVFLQSLAEIARSILALTDAKEQ